MSGQTMYQNDSYIQGYDTSYPSKEEHHHHHSTPPPTGGFLDVNYEYGNTGSLWGDCFKLEPCCGDPCTFSAGCYCCLCYFCCPPCMHAKSLAYSLDQDCAFVNHCGPYLLIQIAVFIVQALIVAIAAAFGTAVDVSSIGLIGECFVIGLYALLRRNLRAKFKVGSPESWGGDFLVACCCCTSPCMSCQNLRSMPIEGWDWLGDISRRGCHCIDTSTLGKIVLKY